MEQHKQKRRTYLVVPLVVPLLPGFSSRLPGVHDPLAFEPGVSSLVLLVWDTGVRYKDKTNYLSKNKTQEDTF